VAQNELWLFPKTNSTLKGRTFQGIEDIQRKTVTTALELIPQKDFRKCFQQVAASLG
jgi:hypothetical protein